MASNSNAGAAIARRSSPRLSNSTRRRRRDLNPPQRRRQTTMGEPLTLQEKLNGVVSRAREVEAEKHFFDAAQPFYPLGFSVGYRNPGHWDVYAQQCPGKASAWKAAHPEGYT